MNKNKIIDSIKSRRTVRVYKKRPISAAKLNQIIDAGRHCQSVHNQQPWKFVIINNKNKIKKIGEFLHNFALKSPIGFNIVLKETAVNIKKAPALIAVYNRCNFSSKVKLIGKPFFDLIMLFEIQSVAAAIQNMCLAADSLNIGTAWLGGPLFCEHKINNLLKEQLKLMAIISLGYPKSKEMAPPLRRPLKEIVKVV